MCGQPMHQTRVRMDFGPCSYALRGKAAVHLRLLESIFSKGRRWHLFSAQAHPSEQT